MIYKYENNYSHTNKTCSLYHWIDAHRKEEKTSDIEYILNSFPHLKRLCFINKVKYKGQSKNIIFLPYPIFINPKDLLIGINTRYNIFPEGFSGKRGIMEQIRIIEDLFQEDKTLIDMLDWETRIEYLQTKV
jgi:hypothetical protein